MILTPLQLWELFFDFFPEKYCTTMTAIALRESGGNTEIFNGNISTGDRSYGLLQINMLNPQVSALIRTIPEVAIDERALFDQRINARAGALLFNGHPNNLNIAWYINHGGDYQKRYENHLPIAQNAALMSKLGEILKGERK